MKGKLLLTALLLGSLLTAGCFEDVTGPYDGPPQVGFAQVGGQYSTAVVDGSGTVTLQVELIAPQQDSAIEIPFTVVDSLTSDGLTEGEDFSFPDGMTFTIPANSSFGEVTVAIPNNEFDAGTTQSLTLRLQESQNGEVAPVPDWQDFMLQIVAREALVTADVETVNFDTVAVGSTARDTLVIANETDATRSTEISNVMITGDGAEAFSLVEAPGATFTLQPGESEAFIVEFAPNTAGDFEAQLTLAATNLADASGLSIALAGVAAGDDPGDDPGDE